MGERQRVRTWHRARRTGCGDPEDTSFTWDNDIAVVRAERLSSTRLLCRLPALGMSRRGSMLENRSIQAFLAVKRSTAYFTKVAELPALRLVDPIQIDRAEPEAFAVEDVEDTSTLEPLRMHVLGHRYFLSPVLSSRRARALWGSARAPPPRSAPRLHKQIV